jgi:aryl sulfotransferase
MVLSWRALKFGWIFGAFAVSFACGQFYLWELYRKNTLFFDITDFETFFAGWIAEGAPFWPLFPHVQSYFDQRACPNLLLVHFSNLKKDLKGIMQACRSPPARLPPQTIADFLGLVFPGPDAFPPMAACCTFEYMKAHEEHFELPAAFMAHGAFINKGASRWRDIYTPGIG